jgi:hypothetical protein
LYNRRIGIMTKRGPACGYKPEYCGVARKLCMLGAINKELARHFEISPSTLGQWMARFPEFKKAIQEGRDVADADVAEKLYERATGYKRQATRFVTTPEGTVESVEYTEHCPPDTAACVFWLRNRRRDLWRERIEHEHDGSSEMLAALKAAVERAARVRRG